MALAGNEAHHLREQQPQYSEFCEHVRQLAGAFELNQLQEFLAALLKDTPVNLLKS